MAIPEASTPVMVCYALEAQLGIFQMSKGSETGFGGLGWTAEWSYKSEAGHIC